MAQPADPPLSNLACVWSASLLTAVESAVVAPSLWRYVESLGGGARAYGACATAHALCRVLAIGPVGFWVDRRPFREVFIAGLALSLGASLAHALAPALGRGALVASRAAAGAASAVSVGAQAYVAAHVPPAARARWQAAHAAAASALALCGPAFHLLATALPAGDAPISPLLGLTLELSPRTWPALALFALQGLALAGFAAAFVEPPPRAKRPRAAGGGGGAAARSTTSAGAGGGASGEGGARVGGFMRV